MFSYPTLIGVLQMSGGNNSVIMEEAGIPGANPPDILDRNGSEIEIKVLLREGDKVQHPSILGVLFHNLGSNLRKRLGAGNTDGHRNPNALQHRVPDGVPIVA